MTAKNEANQVANNLAQANQSDGGLAAAWYRGAKWLWLLRPLELLFRGIAASRRMLYRSGVFSVYRSAKPVVVIGNITVGGTGKTPVVIALVEALQQRGLRPGVVSRGYGASDDEFPHTVSNDSTAKQCGDEPLLIYRRTQAPCVVDPDRKNAVATLMRQYEVDIVLSDDGLQHYAMGRDLEIVLMDAQRGIGNGFCLPAGPLREPPSRLKTVDFVLYRNGTDTQSQVSYAPSMWVSVDSGEQRELAAFTDHRQLFLVAGIGQPQQFFKTVERLGIQGQCHAFPDHHQYVETDFAGMTTGTILMTEKDAVKCAHLAGYDAWYLKISAQLPNPVTERVIALANAYQTS